MPFALIFAGIVLTIAGVRNTQAQLFSLLQGDFTGSNSFIWWSVSIVGIGMVGYVPNLQKLANYFLALVLIVLVLANKGVFTQLINALQTGTNLPKPLTTGAQVSDAGSLSQSLNSLTSSASDLAALGSQLAAA